MSHQRIYRRSLETGEKVSVHMNLNNGLLTVKSRSGDNYGQVIQHRKSPILLSGVELRVQESTLQKIRDTGQRAVCAYAIGEVSEDSVSQSGREVAFNPFERDTFFFAGGEQESVHFTPYLRLWIEETGGERRPHMHAISDEEKQDEVPEKANPGTHRMPAGR